MAAVIDIASCCVTEFALAHHLRIKLISDALTNALAARNLALRYGLPFPATAASTRPLPSRLSPKAVRSPCPWAGSFNAGTMSSPRASSPHSKAS